MKVFCYHGNKSTILLFNSTFRTTPEVSSKLYFVEISEVSDKLWLFNHRRADFLASKFWNIFSLLSPLNCQISPREGGGQSLTEATVGGGGGGTH